MWGDVIRATGLMTGAGTERFDSMTPCLVVPEATVTGCIHVNTLRGHSNTGYALEICCDCGRYRLQGFDDYAWQRPRILRTARKPK